MEEKWYTYKEIVEMFGICKQTLYNWRKNRTIEYKVLTKKTYMYKLPENKNIQENGSQKSL
jgi:predicted site-specific integrase-resolvase